MNTIYEKLSDISSIWLPRSYLTGMTAITFIIVFLSVICMWKIFNKAGKHGWMCIVPVLNVYIMFEIACGKGVKMLFLLIPVFGQLYKIIIFHKLSKAFGYGLALTFAQIIVPPVAMFILAFGNNDYYGPF